MENNNSWKFVVSYFEDIVVQKPTFLILSELAKKLANSEYATQLYPSVSVGVLNIFVTDKHRNDPYSPAISIKHLGIEKVKISYAATHNECKSYVDRICDSTDAWNCVESFILRSHFDTNKNNKQQ